MKKNFNVRTEEIRYKGYLIKLSYRHINKASWHIFSEDHIYNKLYDLYQSERVWDTKETVLQHIYDYIDKFEHRLIKKLQQIKIQTQARKIYY